MVIYKHLQEAEPASYFVRTSFLSSIELIYPPLCIPFAILQAWEGGSFQPGNFSKHTLFPVIKCLQMALRNGSYHSSFGIDTCHVYPTLESNSWWIIWIILSTK